MVANSFAWLLSIVVSCGSSQSGVNDIAVNKNNTPQLSKHFRIILQSRVGAFLVVLLLLLIWHQFNGANSWYFLLGVTIVLSEALNPLFYFVGIEKAALYNLANLLAKLLTLALVLLCIKNADQGPWVNAIIGLANSIFYVGLIGFEYFQKKLVWVKITWADIVTFFKRNSYLLGNNLAANLQQSVFLFALSATGQSAILGAYSLCDKLMWSFRLVVVALFNAIYPKGATLYATNPLLWKKFKKQINQLILIVCSIGAILLFAIPDIIIHLVAGKENAIAAAYLRWMSLVPLLIALNMMNVLELLLAKKNESIFKLGLIILCFAVLSCYGLLQLNARWLGLFPLSVEAVSLLLYLRYMQQIKSTDAIQY